MDLHITGKRALVQGGSAGLGRAVAEALTREGVQVAICSRDEARVQKAAAEMGAAASFACDLTQPGAGARSVALAAEKLQGGVDILVCNTGGPPKGGVLELDAQQWQAGFQSLWLTVTDSLRAALPGMRERRWGRILLITSSAAKEGLPLLTLSNGLRAGLSGLTKSVSNEVAQDNITVNAILPGSMDTDRMRQLGISVEQMSAQIPARRLGKPEELGALCAFLASEQAAYVNGQSIAVDGGFLRGH